MGIRRRGSNLAALVVILATVAWLAGCGNVSRDPPSDAEDTAGDTGSDTGTDVPADTPEDTLPVDTTEDTATTDTGMDPVEDTGLEDPVTDAPDLPDGWPTENPTDWPYGTHPQCRGLGGFCSGGSAILCPWGYEPVEHDDPSRRCDGDGWCCVVAPYSECTDSGTANCVWATSCAEAPGGCWGDATPTMTCESGRVCCVDTCG